jgi:flagellin
MRINTNVSSLNAQANSQEVQKNISKSLEKLASGLAINKAADDGAGLAIADKLRTQASAISQGIKNANSGIAMIQIADKAMDEQSKILTTIKTKLVQAATDTTTDDGRAAIKTDINKLLEQFQNIAEQTNYNGINLLGQAKTFTFQAGEDKEYDITTTIDAASDLTLGSGGSASVEKSSIAVTGTIADSGDSIQISLNGVDYKVEFNDVVDGVTVTDMEKALAAVAFEINSDGASEVVAVAATADIVLSNKSVGLDTLQSSDGGGTITKDVTFTGTGEASGTGTVTVAAGSNGSDTLASLKNDTTFTKADANNYMATIDKALTDLNTNRANLGASQNQLDAHVRNASTAHVYLQSAESIVRDVDYAAETANFNKNNIIAQAGMYAISQANAAQQNIQKLLQ